MIRNIPVCLSLFLVLFCMATAPAASLAQDPEQTVQILEKSVTRAAAAGAGAQNWQAEKEQLIQQLMDLELKDAWTRFQLEKTRQYIASEEKNMAALKENLDRATRTRNGLAPFLEVLYQRLESHVKNDLPFAREERNRRLAFARSALDDPGAGLSDKFGRILEAIQVETDYGYSVEVTEQVVKNPAGGSVRVTQFRLGRLGLFRIMDSKGSVQRYDKASAQWQDIPDADMGEMRKAMEIARKKRVTTLVTLPVGKAPSAGDKGGRI